MSQVRIKQEGQRWILENEHIQVSVEPLMGVISVKDLKSGYIWEPLKREKLSIARTSTPPQIDGDLREWGGRKGIKLTPEMATSHAGKPRDESDCSAEVWLAWDEENLYLGARVRDDVVDFAPKGFKTWWERDSLEVWVGSLQIGFNLNPQGTMLMRGDGSPVDGEAVLREMEAGYVVEARLPWSSLGAWQATVGTAFPFAVGINDSDGEGRKAQLYFPLTWTHSAPNTFAQAVLADEKGGAPPLKETFRNVRKAFGDALAFDMDFPTGRGGTMETTVRLKVPSGSPQLILEVDAKDRKVSMGEFSFLPSFLLRKGRGVVAVADYCDGHIYPFDDFSLWGLDGGRMDLPFVGICDLESGLGYALILDTSDDAFVTFSKYTIGGKQVVAPQVHWQNSKGIFRYPRRIIYHFVPKGGYVAIAKAYRNYAKEKGFVVPFSEKVKRNPHIERLFGAPDVWSWWGPISYRDFVLEAKACGVDKMLINGRPSPADIQLANDIGYLTSEYDNYTDILQVEEGKEVDSNHGRLPDDAVLMANGERMTAWLTWDKKTQFMKRCPALWTPTAQIVIPKVLKEYPFLARFIDVTTAEGLYECYDPRHPLTRGDKRECGMKLLGYVRSLGLVVGGEHGIWWAVPYLDYIEGMMSANPYFSWPAGHLVRPKSKEEEFTDPWGRKLPKWEVYEKWGIGHRWRVPLWELVFHDCIVPTWYWGDSTDFLLEAAPEITPKKDAFNILYGTVPMFWAHEVWKEGRKELMLRSYRNTCRLHEVIADKEMLSHEFLTADHDVQRTIFSDGTEVVVNFGDKPYSLKRGKKVYLLPQNGFWVKGPRIEQYMILQGGRAVTYIKRSDYLFSDEQGTEVEMKLEGKGRMRLHIGAGKEIKVKLRDLAKDWDLGKTKIYLLDREGKPVREVGFRREGEAIILGPFPEFTNLEAICEG